VPAFEKGVAIVIYTTLATAAFLLVYRHGRNFLQSLLRGDPTSIAVLAAMSCAVLSEMLDGIPRKLADFGIDMPLADARAALVIEEVLELGIPVFLAVAAFSAFPRKGRMTAAAAHVHTSEQDGVASRPTL
jgi:hypothetical protein